MISYQELSNLITSGVGLDAEGSGRYKPQKDIIPAINSALQRAVYAGNWALANRKFSEELMSELQETRIIQTNIFGGITLDKIYVNANTLYTPQVWTVLALMVNPNYSPGSPSVLIPTQKTYLRTDLVYLPGGPNEKEVHRMTIEQVARARNDATMSGNEVLASNPKMASFGYYILGNRKDSDTVIDGNRELAITPTSLFFPGPKFVAMSFLRVPALITSVDDTIDMPISTLRLLADWALEYLSWKQGDGTTLNNVASKDAATLFGLNL